MSLKKILAAALAAALSLSAAPAFAAAGVAADITVGINGSYTGSNALGTPVMPLAIGSINRLTAGVAASQADKVFADTRTLSASASENLDLAGVLSDPLGAALTFVKVKAIYIHAAPGNTNNVCIGGAASNPFVGPFADATDIICVKPGGMQLVTAPGVGWTVTPATGDLLKVANSSSGTSVTYDVVIVGTSA